MATEARELENWPIASSASEPGHVGPVAGELIERDPSTLAARPRDMISQWLEHGEEEGQPIRTNLDLKGLAGIAIATKLLLDSPHDNDSLDGQEFVITGVMVTAGRSVDPATGEITIWPRTAVLCKDGSHLVFGGIVALRSALLLIAHLDRAEWARGIKVKVHSQKSKRGGLMQRFEVIT